MKKKISDEVDSLKCYWLEDFNCFPILDLDGIDIFEEAKKYRDKFVTKIYTVIVKCLNPLPLSQKFGNNNWFREYLGDIAYLIAEYKAIEHVEPKLTKYVLEDRPEELIRPRRGATEDLFKKQLVLFCIHIAKEAFKGKAKGYRPEIGYLFSKLGILRITGCKYKRGNCLDSNCIEEKQHQILDPCPKATKQISKVIFDHRRKREYLIPWHISNIREGYSKKYLATQDKKEKTKIIKEIQDHASTLLSRRAVIQSLYRDKQKFLRKSSKP